MALFRDSPRDKGITGTHNSSENWRATICICCVTISSAYWRMKARLTMRFCFLRVFNFGALAGPDIVFLRPRPVAYLSDVSTILGNLFDASPHRVVNGLVG